MKNSLLSVPAEKINTAGTSLNSCKQSHGGRRHDIPTESTTEIHICMTVSYEGGDQMQIWLLNLVKCTYSIIVLNYGKCNEGDVCYTNLSPARELT